MIRECSTDKAMKCRRQKLPVASDAPTATRMDDGTMLFEVARAPSTCVIDFFEARDRLPARDKRSKEFEIHPTTGRVASYRQSAVQRADRLEELLYWLLAAAMMVYLLLEIIGH
jgi:hypothetical protein